MVQTKTFLGANTPHGFSSLFDELYNPYKNCHAYIIKGGPGTGKSSFMKKIAAFAKKKGYDTELVYCSSDPQSLDALIIPELSFSIADGTSPHVLEPQFPGACENIINMGAFWNEKNLFKKADKIRSLTIENSLCHRRSARFLSCAGTINEDTQKLVSGFVDFERVNSFAVRFASRETPKTKSGIPGTKKRRYLSAITPNGIIFLEDTIKALSSRVIAIDDEYGAVSPVLTERIGEFAVRNGYDVIFCRCPMKSRDCCEHIIIPEASLSVITIKSEHPISIVPDRIIHAKRFIDTAALAEHKNRLCYNKKVCRELTEESICFLKKAKAVHDKLEKLYIEEMDFEKANEFVDRFIEKIFTLS